MKTVIRRMGESDLVFADGLRGLAGWNQTLADWRRLLRHEPEGCFVAEQDDEPSGTATTTCYGRELAWIGMVLVHPDRRGHGLGTALIARCLGYLERRGVHCVKLDATPQGQPVYERLGFKPEWTLHRWEVGHLAPIKLSGEFQSWSSGEAVEELDALACGARRGPYLEALSSDSLRGLVHVESGRLNAMGLIRTGTRATYLGPIVARTHPESVVCALLSVAVGQPIYWDIPDHQPAAVELARSLGFVPQRKLIRMVCRREREASMADNPELIFGITGPETG